MKNSVRSQHAKFHGQNCPLYPVGDFCPFLELGSSNWPDPFFVGKPSSRGIQQTKFQLNPTFLAQVIASQSCKIATFLMVCARRLCFLILRPLGADREKNIKILQTRSLIKDLSSIGMNILKGSDSLTPLLQLETSYFRRNCSFSHGVRQKPLFLNFEGPGRRPWEKHQYLAHQESNQGSNKHRHEDLGQNC